MKNIKPIVIVLSLLIFVFTGCKKEEKQSSKDSIGTVLLSSPESAAYDSTNKVIYVSNNVEKGYISKLDMNGVVQEAKWLKGVTSPKGMAVYADKLYISCLKELVEVSTKSGAITNRYVATFEKGSFNDVAIDPRNGDVYLSHTMGNMIYRFKDGSLTEWLRHEDLQHPNGLYVDVDLNKIIVGSFGKVVDFSTWATDPDGHLQTVSLTDKTVGNIGDGSIAIGNIDGVQKIGKQYYVSNWRTGELSRVDSLGIETVIKSFADSKVAGPPMAADFIYVPEVNKLFLPMSAYNKVEVFKLEK